MIITLIAIGLLVLGVIGLVLYDHDAFSYDFGEMVSLLSVAMLMIGIIATAVSLLAILVANIGVEKDIFTKQLEHEGIVKQVECINSDYEDVSKAEVIQKVYDWNKEVYSAKYWSSNPWTSWFWNQRYVDSLEYIELED